MLPALSRCARGSRSTQSTHHHRQPLQQAQLVVKFSEPAPSQLMVLPAHTLFRSPFHQHSPPTTSSVLVLRPLAIIMLILPPRHTPRWVVRPVLIPLWNVDRLRGASRSLGLLRLSLLLWWSVVWGLSLVASARAAVRVPTRHG